MIKLRVFYNRIIQIQRKMRKALMMKLNNIARISQKIIVGLNTLRQILILDKDLQRKYKKSLWMINSITGMSLDSVVDFTARHYILLPSYMHTLNLVRWHALYRNNGRYNKYLYFSALDQVTALRKDQKNLPR